MSSKFSKKEKQSFLLKKYIKEHIFDYVLDMILTVIFVVLILFICDGSNYVAGIILAICCSLVKSIYEIIRYKRDYLDIEITE